MPKRKRSIVYEGVEWTVQKLATRFGKTQQWAHNALRMVQDGRLDMADILKNGSMGRPGPPRKVYRIKYKGEMIELTPKLLSEKAGIHYKTARARLKRVVSGTADPDGIFDAPKNRRDDSKLKIESRRENLPPDRREKYELLKKASLGEINQNEYLRLA